MAFDHCITYCTKSISNFSNLLNARHTVNIFSTNYQDRLNSQRLGRRRRLTLFDFPFVGKRSCAKFLFALGVSKELSSNSSLCRFRAVIGLDGSNAR